MHFIEKHEERVRGIDGRTERPRADHYRVWTGLEN